jgi:acetoacetyl-CoA synthetase
VLDALPGVTDSLVIHLEDPGVLIVALSGASDIDGDAVRAALASRLSPRHVPDHVLVVDRLARNANGKRLEVPTKRVLAGSAVERAVELAGLDDPAAFLSTVDSVRCLLRGG